MSCYAEVRDMIQDGDLIAVRRKTGFFAKLVRWVSRNPYTHVAIAVWADGRLLVAGMSSSGNVLVPLSQYELAGFDVLDCPVEYAKVRENTFNRLGHHVPYATSELLGILIRRWFKFHFTASKTGLICTSFCISVYRDAGWCSPSLPLSATPGEVVDYLTRSQAIKAQVN